MKIALLGAGRTGGKVVDVAKGHSVTRFDANNRPTVALLKSHDVVISFLPGDAMLNYIDMLVESEIPVVSGSTGFKWPSNINERLQEKGLAWITASNFAIGMNLIKAMIRVLAKSRAILPEGKFKLHEVHHISKKDTPSGTAKSWANWLGLPVEFSDDRSGDVVGDHKLTLVSEFEDISVEHTAKDRKVFAKGAVWTAKYLLDNNLKPGLYELSNLMEKELEL